MSFYNRTAHQQHCQRASLRRRLACSHGRELQSLECNDQGESQGAKDWRAEGWAKSTQCGEAEGLRNGLQHLGHQTKNQNGLEDSTGMRRGLWNLTSLSERVVLVKGHTSTPQLYERRKTERALMSK